MIRTHTIITERAASRIVTSILGDDYRDLDNTTDVLMTLFECHACEIEDDHYNTQILMAFRTDAAAVEFKLQWGEMLDDPEPEVTQGFSGNISVPSSSIINGTVKFAAIAPTLAPIPKIKIKRIV